jgi:hypothetical protein
VRVPPGWRASGERGSWLGWPGDLTIPAAAFRVSAERMSWPGDAAPATVAGAIAATATTVARVFFEMSCMLRMTAP